MNSKHGNMHNKLFKNQIHQQYNDKIRLTIMVKLAKKKKKPDKLFKHKYDFN